MSYVVLARKYRPQTLNELSGQSHISRALTHAIEMDRVAHAFLFCGVRGTGKTSTARIVAKMLNCEQGPTPNPCGVCQPCEEIAKGNAIDVREIDAASNRGINEMRALRETTNYPATRDRYRIYIIDEVHMLTKEAANAFLKTLEEPPKGIYFILATTDPQRLLVTIRSRCQRYDFRRIKANEVVGRLQYICEQEGIEMDAEALYLIAREGDGSLRDSLSVLDQVIAFGGETMSASEVANLLGVADRTRVTEMIAALLSQDAQRALSALASAHNHGMELKVFSKTLAMEARDLLMIRMMGHNADDLVDRSESEVRVLRELINGVDGNTLERLSHTLLELAEQMAVAAHPRLVMELALIRLCRAPKLKDVAALASQVNRLVMTGRLPQATQSAPAPRSTGQATSARTQGRPTPRARAQRPAKEISGDDDVPSARVRPKAPRPPPAQPKPTTPSPPTINFSDQHLQALCESASDSNHSTLVPLLEDAVVEPSPANVLCLGFSSDYSVRLANQSEVRKSLVALASALVNQDVDVQISGVVERARDQSIRAKTSKKRQAKKRQDRQALQQHPSVVRVLAVMGGEIAQIDLATPDDPKG
ncbi:MAG TPA: hypothetical protein DCQ06_06170 [Myxococcales bacterium]|nr:hypothetical protein [Myxococcales bacterium]HAN31168.1 hypothetical protein [Myxococcales bacterium]